MVTSYITPVPDPAVQEVPLLEFEPFPPLPSATKILFPYVTAYITALVGIFESLYQATQSR